MKVKDYILKFKDNFDGFEITITDVFWEKSDCYSFYEGFKP
jgi:hypothetical protein